MPDYPQAFWLALLQGLTEFLPISSSAHLALLPQLAGWRDQGLAFDVAVHVGTLLAALVYFRADVAALLTAWARSLAGAPPTAHSRLAWSILFATLIIALAGWLFGNWVERLRAPLPIALATLLFGVALGLADWLGGKRRDIEQLNWKDVALIGCAQALALVPGVSRSGITITAGLLLGFGREAAARFSFLLAMPVIALAGLWQTHSLLAHPAPVRWDILLFATFVSAVVALACIHYLLIFLRRHSLLPFVIYRLALGAVLLWVVV